MILIDGKQCGAISALDRGYAYGDGVFRTMRIAGGRIRLWSRHYQKLAEDALALGIVCPPETLLHAETETVIAGVPDCVVKIVVTRGQGGRGYAPPDPATPMRMVARFDLPQERVGHRERGVRVRWCETRLGMQPRLAGVKHLNRLENVLARGEWSDPEIAEGLLLDQRGNVIEGTASNLILLEAGGLVTPSLVGCGVDGVQKAWVIEIAQGLGLRCESTDISLQRLIAADQVLLTNSVIGMWWVSRLDRRHWARQRRTIELLHALDRSDA